MARARNKKIGRKKRNGTVMGRISVYTDRKTWFKFQDLCQKQGTNGSAVLTELVGQYMRARG